MSKGTWPHLFLFIVVIIDGGPILSTHIIPWSIGRGWVMPWIEEVNKLVIPHFLRIIGHLDCLCMASALWTHLYNTDAVWHADSTNVSACHTTQDGHAACGQQVMPSQTLYTQNAQAVCNMAAVTANPLTVQDSSPSCLRNNYRGRIKLKAISRKHTWS